MLIENKTGLVADTHILDDNDELMGMVHKVEFAHEAGQLPIATINCHRPTIKSKVSGRISWNLKDYTREQKESLYRELKKQLDD